MAGFLIIKGGPGTLDGLPEIKAAKDLVMGFQVIRTDLNGYVPLVNEQATQFGTFPFGTVDPTNKACGARLAWMVRRDAATSIIRPTASPTRPCTLLVSLQGHGLSVVAMDGITVGNMQSLSPDTPIVIGPGRRYDVLVKAGAPGTYLLQSLDPAKPASVLPRGSLQSRATPV